MNLSPVEIKENIWLWIPGFYDVVGFWDLCLLTLLEQLF